MRKIYTVLAVLAVTLISTAGLAAASNHTDMNDQTDYISVGDATEAARQALSDADWEVTESELDDGEYSFELRADSREAEVVIDATDASVISVEEEGEQDGVEYEAEQERDEDEAEAEAEIEVEQEDEQEESETEDTASNVSTLEEAREQIRELREEVRELRATVSELRSNQSARDELPDEASDQAREARERRGPPSSPGASNREQRTEVEVEQEGNETEVEVDRRGAPGDRGPNQAARENVNGTPGNSSERPGFVRRMLQNMFS